MGSVNKVILVGNLGRDPEMRYTPNGQAVTQFTVAVNRNFKDQDGSWQEETEWFRVVVFGQQAERAAEYLRKGGKVYVEGRLQTRRSGADHGHVPHTAGADGGEHQLGLVGGARVDQAARPLPGEDLVQAGLVAGDAGDDLTGAAGGIGQAGQFVERRLGGVTAEGGGGQAHQHGALRRGGRGWSGHADGRFRSGA